MMSCVRCQCIPCPTPGNPHVIARADLLPGRLHVDVVQHAPGSSVGLQQQNGAADRLEHQALIVAIEPAACHEQIEHARIDLPQTGSKESQRGGVAHVAQSILAARRRIAQRHAAQLFHQAVLRNLRARQRGQSAEIIVPGRTRELTAQ